MPTVRLVPSAIYNAAGTSYISVSNADNAYTNTDSDTYATITNTYSSTTSRYVYVRGFNFSAVPDGSIINSFTIKLKARESGVSTSDSYKPYLADETNALNGTCDAITTTASVYTFSGYSYDFDTIKGYGTDFGIRINCRRASRNTTGYVYIYGAEIEVDYTLPVYHRVTATSEVNGVTVSPIAEDVLEGNSHTITIDPGTYALSDLLVEDNGTDVTSQLVEHTSEDATIERYPASYTTSGSISGTNYQSAIGKGSDASNASGNDYCSSSGSTAYINYSFDFSDIPANATIESVSVSVKGHCESTSNSSEVARLQLYSGSTAKGSEANFTSTSDSVINMTTGTWTRAELQNAILRFTIGYYGGRVVGATWRVTYSIPSESSYYTYTISNVQADHTIVISLAGAFVPPEEDPEKTYYSLTISSVNASTDPSNGTTRVEAGTNHTVTITPTDPQLTLALDNGVDITSQLVGGVPTNTYTVTTQVSGASYGFNLNSSTGYYVSSNNGVSKSASVARLNMDFESDCVVTITYINYAEENYDYGMFGKLDTAVATDGLTASSGGSSPSDSTSNYQLARCSNSSSTQTITYQVPAGEHFIDIKYGKDDASDANNDSLQWKVTSVEATSAGGDYTYTLTNMSEKHSLIFVFGNVSYYFVTSSVNSGARIYPDGQMVKLDGQSYHLVIVPDDPEATVTLTDNNVDVTSQLSYEEGTDKSGNKVVNYTYDISSVTAAHTLVVSCSSGSLQVLYFKQDDRWVAVTKAYVKQNGAWVEQAVDTVFTTGVNYRKG